jgi:ATP-dependent Lon protease
MTKERISIAALPLRDIVVFPGMIVPLFVGREKSIRSLDYVSQEESEILLLTQKDAASEEPTIKDLYRIGVSARILQLLRLPDGTMKVLIEAQSRMIVKEFDGQGEMYIAEAVYAQESAGNGNESEALMRSVVKEFEEYIKLNKKINPEIITTLQDIVDPGRCADAVASHLVIRIAQKQEILDELHVVKRLKKILSFMDGEISVLNTEKRIRTRVKRQMEKTQKDYYLNEQLKAIQKELGEGDEGKDEISEIEATLKKLKLSKEARDKSYSEIRKLRLMSPMSAEATVLRNYLDWLTALPWKKYTKVEINLVKAQDKLEADHYGLEKVKERILEYLAVQTRTEKLRGPILCLMGPPGVGKTSLARSIAEAVGRKFVRISLGGVRDEAEIRGHRRTYIGSMPGKIIQSLKKAGSSKPLILLDEIDKMGLDFRGDPASALLEVLDPEQNSSFVDHYLEVEYDLSDVMFVTTANSSNMPRPLLDRMEMIRIAGYTEDEKIEIAKRHLVPKQVEAHGLKPKEFQVSEEAIRDLIRYYTREAGVRNLERELANLARKSVKEIVSNVSSAVHVTARNLNKYAGVRRYLYGEAETEDLVGVTTGLAYTEVGGDLLLIESVALPGKGTIKTTGKLGDVMQESAQAAFSFVRSRAHLFGIPLFAYQQKEIHIHVPEGATPKDGPSAGIAMFTSLVSLLTGIPVKKSVAMTGEITLRGRVLGIGGLKEKLLAALRGGITTVLIPTENVKDLVEIPANVKKHLTIIPVATADEVLQHALCRAVVPIAEEKIPILGAVLHSEEDDSGETSGDHKLRH